VISPILFSLGGGTSKTSTKTVQRGQASGGTRRISKATSRKLTDAGEEARGTGPTRQESAPGNARTDGEWWAALRSGRLRGDLLREAQELQRQLQKLDARKRRILSAEASGKVDPSRPELCSKWRKTAAHLSNSNRQHNRAATAIN